MTTSVYVGNVPYDTTEAVLRTLFEGAGEVSLLRVLTDATTGASQGTAYVEYTDPAAAQRAIALFHGYLLGDQQLLVHEAGPDLARQDRTWRVRSEHPDRA